MMNSNTGLALLFVVALWFPAAAAVPPTYNPTFGQMGTIPSPSTLSQLHTNAAEPGSLNFILFGDGYFQMGVGNSLTFPHKYPNTNTTYSAKAYFVKGYSPDLPTLKTANVSVGATVSTFVNPTLAMSTASPGTQIGTSWFPSPSGWYFTILTIKNTCSSTRISGSIKYYFKNAHQITPTTLSDLLIYNNWINTSAPGTGIMVSDDPNYESMLVANYSNLNANEIRHIYIKSTVASTIPVGTIVNTKLVLLANGCPNSTYFGDYEVKGTPHDPNGKSVDKTVVCAENLDPHSLVYKIHFQNDGTAVAQNVSVSDNLPSVLKFSSAQLVSFSSNCTMDPSPPSLLMFTFLGINLPGSNQTIPNIYSYDQTVGSLSFKVNTNQCLPAGTVILNHASVIFPGQPPVLTTEAITYVDESNCDLTCHEPAHRSAAARVEPGAQIVIAPNPAVDDLLLQFTPNDAWEVQIYGTQGRLFFSESGETVEDQQQNIRVAVQNWPPGIYFVQWKDANQHPASRILKM